MTNFNESRIQQYWEVQKPGLTGGATGYAMRLPPDMDTGVFLFETSNGNATIRVLDFNDLSDVNTAGATAGNVLTLGSTGIWGPTGLSLNSLDNVDVSGATCGDVFQFFGPSGWNSTSLTDYSEMYINNDTSSSVITIPVNDIDYTGIGSLASNGMTGGITNNFTFSDDGLPASPGDTGAYFTTINSGIYYVNYSVSSLASSNIDFQAAVHINKVIQVNTIQMRELSNNNVGSTSLGGIISLSANDTVDVRFRRTSSGNSNVLFVHFNFTISKIANDTCQ